MASPNIRYLSPDLGETFHASYNAGYNSIEVRFISDLSLNYYEARVTKEGEDYDVGVGALAFEHIGSWAANTEHSYTITVDNTLFPNPGTYRISLYAREALENTWDVTYLFITSEADGSNLVFQPVGAEGLEVLKIDK